LQVWADRVGAAIDALESEAERMVGARNMPGGTLQEWRRV
jgi:hypothetical protein